MKDEYGYPVQASPEVLADLRGRYENGEPIEEYAKSVGVVPPAASAGTIGLLFDGSGNELGLYWDEADEPQAVGSPVLEAAWAALQEARGTEQEASAEASWAKALDAEGNNAPPVQSETA